LIYARLTLGNFNYRKMTLVRDFTKLIETDLASRAFDTIFFTDAQTARRSGAGAIAIGRTKSGDRVRRYPGWSHCAGENGRELHHSRTTGHGKIADDNEFDRRLRRSRKTRAICLRKARSHRRGIPSVAATGIGRTMLFDSRFADGPRRRSFKISSRLTKNS
jgi:hypothetical protein